ncbi:MAG: ABC transporter substrate-binding protein [Trueperaceae bacterium]
MRLIRTLTALLLVAGLAFAQTTVNYYSFTTDQGHVDELEGLIAEFEAQNPGIEIAYTTAPFDSYFTKLQTDFAAGNPPDVFELNYENFVTFASRGTLAPLDARLAADAEVSDDTFYPAALDAFAYDGVQYGLPITFSTVVLFYNQDLFDAAGIAYPTDDWTWDDVMTAAAAISDPANRVWGIYQPVQFWEFYKVAQAAGGGLQVGPEIVIDSPENRAALDYLVGKITAGVMPTDAQMSGMANEDLFQAGQLGMLVSGIWMFDRFSQADFAWDIVVEPGGERRATHFFANAAVVSARTDVADAAYAWTRFLAASPEVAAARIESNWELPALSLSNTEALSPYLERGVPANREAVFASLAYAVTPPVVDRQPELQDVINQELEAARLGTKTVAEALASAQRRVESLLAD